MTTNQARQIHRRSRRRSPNPGEGMGVSELFTASPLDQNAIFKAADHDKRMAMYLLGFTPAEIRKG